MTEIPIFLTLLSATALCAAAETAFFSLHQSEVRMMEHHGEKYAGLVARLRADPQKLLVTILLLNTLANITIASYATLLATRSFGSEGLGIATGIATFVTLIFGEIFPKSLAITHKRKIARWLSPLFAAAVAICTPITVIILSLEHWALKSFGKPKRAIISEEEVRVAAELGLEHGSIDRREREMIERVFRFDDVAVREIMTPLTKIDGLDGEAAIKEIAHYVASVGYSRFPVYEGGQRNYIGYVHVIDVLRALNSDDRDNELRTIASPLTRIDANMKLEQAFLHMLRERSHLYLVHEHNDDDTVIGLVTLEDMVEEILGEIEDEGDRRDAGALAHARRVPVVAHVG